MEFQNWLMMHWFTLATAILDVTLLLFTNLLKVDPSIERERQANVKRLSSNMP
jgi:hypothetical protein